MYSAEHYQKWYKGLSPEKRAARLAAKRASAASLRRFCAAYKLFMGCADCGYNFSSVALDFDHVRGVKEFAIGPIQCSFLTLVAEIEKCDVRCANCHRIRTFASTLPGFSGHRRMLQ